MGESLLRKSVPALPEAGECAEIDVMMELLDVLKKDAMIRLVVHNNPDPDALASALALRYYLGRLGYLRVRIHGLGLVGRAENKAMMRNLKLTVRPLRAGRLSGQNPLVLLDAQPGTGNVTLPRGAKPVGVIDHHPLRKATKSVPYYDVRPNYGACATILYEYLVGAGLPIPGNVATGLFHAISSETQSLGREGSPEDKRAYLDLLPRVNFGLLSKIQYPPLSKAFVAHLLGALSRAFYYKNLVGAILKELPYPDFAAEMADFLLRIQKLTWSIVVGTYEDSLYVSVRSSRPRADAGRTTNKIIPRSGTSGGHGHSAGAQVKIDRSDTQKTEALAASMVGKLLRILTHVEVPTVYNLVTDEEMPLSSGAVAGAARPAPQD
jgi:nanoRNase/pAp phosphatase (c-di-AMP/oligoRNAs hydrolase)